MAVTPFKKKLLPCLIAMSFSAVPYALAHADEQPEADASTAAGKKATTDDDVEHIEVTGYRSSLKANLFDKKNADDVREVVNAEDMGKFPDKNVAESLQRITGVSIQRQFGEGERVSIRGTAPNLNRTLLNGHGVATADWFILDQLNATRSFNYLMLPSETVSKLEVIKSPQADVEEGSIGGTVNVETRKPLDMKSMVFAATAEAVINDKSDKTKPLVSGLFSWKNDDQTIGFLISGQTSENDIRRDGIEVLGYTDRAIADQGGAVLAAPDFIGSAYFTQKRKRDSVNSSIQFRPGDHLDITVNGLYSKMDADNVNSNFAAWTSNMFGAGAQPHDTVVGANGTLLAGTFDSSQSGWGAVYDTFVREAYTKTSAYDVDLKYTADNWTYTGKLGTTEAKGGTDRQLIWETVAHTGFRYDLRGSAPQVQFTDIDPASMNPLPVNGWNGERDVGNKDTEDFAYLNAEWRPDSDLFTAVKFGVKYTTHERDVDYNGLVGQGLYGDTSCGGQPCGVGVVAGDLTPGDFLSGHSGILGSYRLVDPGKLYDIYNQYPSRATCTPDLTVLPCTSPVASNTYQIEEDALGGYVMAKFEADKLHGNLGFRIVKTDVTARGYTTGLDANTPGASWNIFDGYYAPNKQDSSYTDVLPSFNIAYTLRDDVVLRFAAARVMARPDYGRMAPVVGLNSTTYTGSGGSPDLDPYRADQFDLSAEWYIGDETALSAAYFYKDIQSYIVNKTFTELHATYFDPNGTVQPGSNCTAVAGGVYNCSYAVDRPVNGSGGHNEGVELAYQQVFENGFGWSGNYTWSEAKSDSGDLIPGNSKNSYNLSVFFENKLVNARLSYNYRDAFFIDIDHGRQQFSDDVKQLDASFGFNVTDNIQLVAEAQNLTNEEIKQYYDDNTGRPNAIYQNGRTYYAGVRVKF